MGWGPLFFHVKLNLIDPCCTVRDSKMVEGCQAGGLGHQFLYLREYNAESPKQGRKRFNSIVKMINFSYLPIIYLCSSHTRRGSLQGREGPLYCTLQSTYGHHHQTVLRCRCKVGQVDFLILLRLKKRFPHFLLCPQNFFPHQEGLKQNKNSKIFRNVQVILS